MGLLDYDGKTLVGKVLKVGVYPTFELVLQSDYFEPPEFLLMGVWVYTRVIHEFLSSWHCIFCQVAIGAKRVHRSRLSAVGFSMEQLEGLPLSWPLLSSADLQDGVVLDQPL